MAANADQGGPLRRQVEEIETESGAKAVAVAVHDTETNFEFRHDADRWFHAASTIKVPILLGVFDAVDRGALLPHSRVHVRNLFHSVVEGIPFRVNSDRDANGSVHAAVGKMLRVEELAHHMIATSSNLATNLLLDLVGVEAVRKTLRDLNVAEGVDVKRGVEDELAFEKGIYSRVTAAGLLRILLLLAEGKAFSPTLSHKMMEILHAQEFNKGIPALLPKGTRVAHKTGDISTVAHDAGVVYLADRKPYVLVILTEWDADASGRSKAIAAISHAVYETLAGPEIE
jgi:beta-lactamase class A